MSKRALLNKMTVMTIALFCLGFASCSNDDESEGGKVNSNNILVYENLGDPTWDYLAVDNQSNFLISDEEDGLLKNVIGYVDSDTIFIRFNDNGLPTEIEATRYNVSFEYLRDRVVFVYNVDSICANDTLKFETEYLVPTRMQTRATDSNGSVIASLFNAALDEIPGVGQVKSFLELMNYLRDTDNMNSHEKINYLADGKHQFVNEEKVNKWLKLGDEKKTATPPTYCIGIVTGNAPYIYETSAVCNMDGVLKATANDVPFNFEYGICYSVSSNPSIGQRVSKLYSGSESSITLSMPVRFLIEGLTPNTKYYYRAYFKDNITGKVFYAKNIRSFTTSSIPVTISSFVQTNSYYSENGYSNNGRTYRYKYLSSLKVEISKLDGISDWGYYLVGDNGNRIAYSMMSRGTSRCDDILTVFSNSTSTIARVGGYVKYQSDNTAYYTNPNEYNLEYNDDIELSFYDCSFNEVTHFYDETKNSYRCGAIFDVYFKVKGAENLTSLSIVPFGNFLSWDSSKTYSTISDGDYMSTITCKYIYEYGLYGNFYCFLLAKDLDGKEHYSKNIIRMYHDGYHFTSTVVADYESLNSSSQARMRVKSTSPIIHPAIK